MVLGLRGWGAAEFATAEPSFLAASRWAVMLEAVMPQYQRAESLLAEPYPSEPTAKLALAAGKQAAQRYLDAWRPVLFPEDDD